MYIGLMSGTSLDGVDAAMVDFAPGGPRVLATHFAPFPPALRAQFMALQAPGDDELTRAALAANQLAQSYADGVADVLRSSGVHRSAVRAIGAHGQTVRHRPEAGFTLQLNNPALLAELTGIAVVADFRSRDVAAGGQGAPLAPGFHAAFFSSRTSSRAVLNIGGIANLTVLAPGKPAIGFDTGPGNVLLDAWIARHRGAGYDEAGAWAASGRAVPALLAALLSAPFFALPPPKSTGRDLFNPDWLDRALAKAHAQQAAPEDVQATLLDLTAHSICNALHAHAVETLYVCGGGAHNQGLMRRLAALVAPCRVTTTADLGVPEDWVEAVAFAWLAWRRLEGQPGNLDSVTGAAGPRVLGAIHAP